MFDNSKILSDFKPNKFIKDLKPGDKNLDMKFILIEKKHKIERINWNKNNASSFSLFSILSFLFKEPLEESSFN